MEGAHWVHLENPEKFNNFVRDWLEGLKNTIAPIKRRSTRHAVDEL
jgi:soluble epoxide hydrolase/lipid-phosphate phosphatase